MEEARLDNELQRIYSNLTFLWKNHNFHVRYFTRDFGLKGGGFMIGLENDVCKLIFRREAASQVDPIISNVGTKTALFQPPDGSYSVQYGWYPLTELIGGLSGVKYENVKNVDHELANLNQYLRLYIDKVLELFKRPEELNNWLHYYRDLYKDKQVTMDQIRAERARLRALGQTASTEAAIDSLRGGKK